MSCVNNLYRYAHLFHDVNSVFEREYDALLCGTHNMVLAVGVKVQTANRAVDLSVVEHSFGTVAKWQNADTCATYRRFGCKSVHFVIRNALWSYVAFNPRVQYASSVYAKQYT